MADNADIAADLEAARIDQSLAAIVADLPEGEPGECEDCGEDMPRLVAGRCGFCRDGRRPPLSFYAARAAAPSSPASTKEEHVPMVNTIPAVLSRKIEVTGGALAAIEKRALADDKSFKQAAADLIELGVRQADCTIPPVGSASPDGSGFQLSGGVLSVANVDELFDELRARFDAAFANQAMEEALQAANARADAAEQKLADLKALLSA